MFLIFSLLKKGKREGNGFRGVEERGN